ncbi:MAG: response regulator [Planctomycetes bacterium]|nr:response regulator [Planctomycetota bacterium]
MKRTPSSASRPIRILVIDDSVEQARRLTEIFQQARIPVTVEAVTNGVDAINRVQGWGRYTASCPPDVALIDLDLPGLDGLAVLSVIKADRHAGIISVAYAHALQRSQRDACEAMGADACLSKPHDFESYITLLAEILFFLSMRDDSVLAWWGGGVKPGVERRRRPR